MRAGLCYRRRRSRICSGDTSASAPQKFNDNLHYALLAFIPSLKNFSLFSKIKFFLFVFFLLLLLAGMEKQFF
jgi:hypothetical protein